MIFGEEGAVDFIIVFFSILDVCLLDFLVFLSLLILLARAARVFCCQTWEEVC